MSDRSDEAKRFKFVGNERAKLSATFLNNIAGVILGSGLIAPFFFVLYGLGNLTADQNRFFSLAAPGWVSEVSADISLHPLFWEGFKNDLA